MYHLTYMHHINKSSWNDTECTLLSHKSFVKNVIKSSRSSYFIHDFITLSIRPCQLYAHVVSCIINIKFYFFKYSSFFFSFLWKWNSNLCPIKQRLCELMLWFRKKMEAVRLEVDILHDLWRSKLQYYYFQL